jgi:transcriptional regulator with XRE-family HTH domain
MSTAGKNLKYLRKQKSLTQEEMAEQLNIKRSLIGAYEEERAEPRLEIVQVLCDMFQISLEDFLFKDLSEGKLAYLQKRRAGKMDEDRAAIIPFVPVKATAGYMAGYGDPAYLDELNTFTLPMLAPGNYRAFEIVGDSMMPTPSGSIIVGEKVQEIEAVRPMDTYIVVSRTEGIVYKRIEKANRSKKQLTLVSDNPAYRPYTVSTSDIAELWQARFIISKPSTQPGFDVNHLANVVNTLQEQVTHLKKQIS